MFPLSSSPVLVVFRDERICDRLLLGSLKREQSVDENTGSKERLNH
jgi:hypothetical protein